MKKRIPEIILVSVIVILIGILIWIPIASYPYKIRQEYVYGYSAYKITYTDNSIITMSYTPRGDMPIWVDTTYLENGKAIKIIEEWHFKTINAANESYKSEIKYGRGEFISSIKRNVITRIIENPIYLPDVYFKTNEEYIKAYEERMKEMPSEAVRIY